MNRVIAATTTAMALALMVAPAFGQQPKTAADCKANAPAKVEGQITSVDPSSGRVTLRGTDGKTHEFQATKETAQTMKPGDKLEARLREQPKC